MRICYLSFVLGMISCSQSQIESNLDKKTIKDKSYIENSDSLNLSETGFRDSIFTNKDESYVLVTIEKERIETIINNVNYSEKYLSRGNSLKHYILKTNKLTKVIRGHEGQFSSIKIEIFDIPDSKLISTIETKSDDIIFFTNYFKTVKYGCCGAEHYCALYSLWDNEIFLKFNSKYYQIVIPNSGMNFYVGFLSDARSEDNLILGELYFAHSILKSAPGGRKFLQEFKTINKLIFKTKDKDLYGKIVPFCPDITLIKNSDKDELFDYPDRQELRLWSYNFCKDPKEVNFKALKLEFSNGKIYTVEVPIENGHLLGEVENYEKTVYVEE